MNSSGQIEFPIVPFVIGVIFLIILGPLLFKALSTTKSSLDTSLGNLSSNNNIAGALEAKDAADAIFNTGINFLDEMIIFSFVILLILLFISAFLIDSHPFWAVLWIVGCFILVIIMPYTVEALRDLYAPGLILSAAELNNFNFVNVLINNFGKFLAIIMAITGIIIYGKVFSFGDSGGRA